MSKSYKILVAHTHYPMTIARYIKAGLRKAGHTVDSVGYYTGADIPWPGNPKLTGYEDQPTYRLPDQHQFYDIDDHLRAIAKDYDLFLNVDAAYYWRGNPGIPKVIIGTDPHCINYDQQRRDCDLFVCMQKGYSQPGDAWLPYAYDSENHWNHGCSHTIDVAFVGVQYENRRRDLDALASMGIGVYRDLGKVFYEFADILSQSLFSYCTPSLQDLPARFFESMAIGAVPITTRVREMDYFPDLIPGVHYVEYSNTVELVGRLRKLLAAHRQWAGYGAETSPIVEMINAGKEWVHPHSWENRANELIALVEQKLGWSA